jgi:hypothetical protein
MHARLRDVVWQSVERAYGVGSASPIPGEGEQSPDTPLNDRLETPGHATRVTTVDWTFAHPVSADAVLFEN